MKCLVCHRELKNKESIERGIGPVCLGRIIKITKQDKVNKKARAEINHRKAEITKGQISLFEEENDG